MAVKNLVEQEILPLFNCPHRSTIILRNGFKQTHVMKTPLKSNTYC